MLTALALSSLLICACTSEESATTEKASPTLSERAALPETEEAPPAQSLTQTEGAADVQLLQGYIQLHDPAGFMELDGYLLTFATSRTMKSAYLPTGGTEWIRGKPVFPEGTTPAWHEEVIPGNKGVWAPHAAFPRVLYYSIANDSDGLDIGAIGRATAIGDPPNLTWVDDGVPVLVCDRHTEEEPFAIDPAVFVGKDGTLWMVYGSHWSGIYIVELDPATGHLKDTRAGEEGWTKDNPAFHRVASELGEYNDKPVTEPGFTAGAIEAPYVFWNGQDDYYLFVNWGMCCSGIESTYEIRVGRSDNPYGPYLDKDGHDMAEGGGTLFLKTDGRFIGPGHANIWTYTDSNSDARHIFSYHFYDGEDEERPGRAKMHARELEFDDDGWPVLTDHSFSHIP